MKQWDKKEKRKDAPQKNPSDNQEDLNARLIALDILGCVLDKRQALDQVLEGHSGFLALDARERAFVRMLVTTTIRRLGQIDDLIHRAQDRPQTAKASVVLHILRLGVTQLFFMAVPDHASVDTSVRLAQASGAERQKAFINAILRTLTRTGHVWRAEQDAPRLNTPEWLMQIWVTDYGQEIALEIAKAHLEEAPLDITIKDAADKEDLLTAHKAIELPTGSMRRISGGNVSDFAGYYDGKWWVQDAAAALPAQLFGVLRQKTVIDLCAAPGGKTMQLAALGARVVALDRSAKRMKRLEENLMRMNLENMVEVIVADAAAWCSPPKTAKYILLDAPCSATGTLRRHPDTQHLKSLHDITGLMSIQENLLKAAAGILEKDGILVYCTCSLQKGEGEHQIEKFLENNSAFKRSPIHSAEIGAMAECINENGEVRILPFHMQSLGGMDGFFIARLRKIQD